jgi:UDPglucose 6-dehydrogenase
MIGTGYVGLVSGTCFSEFGFEVTCVDTDRGKIALLKDGRVPIYEPGLNTLIVNNTRAGRLSFSTDIAEALPGADVVMIAVGTPSRRGDGHADLSFIFEAARQIADNLSGYTVVVTKSTVPVGTGRQIEHILAERRKADMFDVVSNPEFLREGSAIEDFMRPDRVVVGADTERARRVMAALYRPLNLIKTPILFTKRETAEMIKYAANAFLATKISFINEIADLCEQIGANVQDVAEGIGLDGRIGRKFLHAGPGFGGSCFPKDTRALVQLAIDAKAPLRIVEAVVAVNEARKARMAEKVEAMCGGTLQGKTLAVLGVTFKPNTDDVRESPAVAIIASLLAKGAKVQAYDPEGMTEGRKILDGPIIWCANAYETMAGAAALLILTEWNEFRALDLARVKRLLKSPLIIDLRNIYRRDEMAAAGFVYASVGRSTVQPGQTDTG